MGDGKPNIVEKSYKLLFVIYAPIALLSYVINAVGGFKISFLSIFLICVSVLSAVLALLLIIRYAFKRSEIINTPDSNRNAPFLFRHDFLIPFIFISITSFSVLSLLIYSGAVKELTYHKKVIATKSENTTIVLILGLSDQNIIDSKPSINNTFYDYGASEIQALSMYQRFSPSHGNHFDFDLIDHQMKYSEELEMEIVQLMKKGVIYFVCTTSSISVPLSRKFEQLISKSGTTSKPILICTNASSPEVQTKSNSVYRFFIRSSEQTKLLVKKSISLNLKTINFIAINNEYGKGSIESFDKSWSEKGNLSISGIYLDPIFSEERIIEEIKTSNILSNNPDAIYIPADGVKLQAIIKAIADFSDDIVLLSSAAMTVKHDQLAIKDILLRKKWFTVAPKTKAEEEIFSYNIYTSFLYMSIIKLTKTIEKMDEDPDLSFHDEWTKTESPRLLDFEYDKKGDFIIHSRLDSSLTD